MSYSQTSSVIFAATQTTLALIDRDAALERACELIVDAGLAGARLIIFPPAFIPGCPDWVWSIAPDEDPLRDELYAAIRIQAVPIPSAVTDRLCRVAQRAGVAVVIGLVERAEAAEATNVYSALLSIDAHGEILGRYRASALAPRPAWTRVVAATSAERARVPVTQAVRDVGGI